MKKSNSSSIQSSMASMKASLSSATKASLSSLRASLSSSAVVYASKAVESKVSSLSASNSADISSRAASVASSVASSSASSVSASSASKSNVSKSSSPEFSSSSASKSDNSSFSASKPSASKSNMSESSSSNKSKSSVSKSSSGDVTSIKTVSMASAILVVCLAVIAGGAFLYHHAKYGVTNLRSNPKSVRSTYLITTPRAGYNYDSFSHFGPHSISIHLGDNVNGKQMPQLQKQLSKLPQNKRNMYKKELIQSNRMLRNSGFKFHVSHVTYKKGQYVAHGTYGKKFRNSSSYQNIKSKHTIKYAVHDHGKKIIFNPKSPQVKESIKQAKSLHIDPYSKRVSPSRAKKLLKADNLKQSDLY